MAGVLAQFRCWLPLCGEQRIVLEILAKAILNRMGKTENLDSLLGLDNRRALTDTAAAGVETAVGLGMKDLEVLIRARKILGTLNTGDTHLRQENWKLGKSLLDRIHRLHRHQQQDLGIHHHLEQLPDTNSAVQKVVRSMDTTAFQCSFLCSGLSPRLL